MASTAGNLHLLVLVNNRRPTVFVTVETRNFLMDGKQLRLYVPISHSAFAERTSERNLLLLLASGVQSEESGGIRCISEKK
jgi:hypothetical protein